MRLDRPTHYVLPDYGRARQELRRKGMTLMLLWEEYVAARPGQPTYRYSQFCERYRRYAQIGCDDLRFDARIFLKIRS